MRLEKIKFSEKEESVEYNNEYILGAGDILTIDFLGLDIFTGNYSIQPDGFLSLPEINEVYAKGKTVRDLKMILEKKYDEYVYSPDISVSISNHRSLNVTLRGEVNKTGLFKLSYSKKTIPDKKIIPTSNIGIDINKNNSSGYSAPKLFDLIQLGNGITSNADLKNIQVVRENPSTLGGGKIKTTVNLIALLEDGNQEREFRFKRWR